MMTKNEEEPIDAEQLWQSIATRGGVAPTRAQIEMIHRFLDLLTAANERLNLTRITGRDQALVMHIADAMTVLPHLPQAAHALADIGSGGGVPGIPIAIMRPDVAVTLIESTGKKCEFLSECVKTLGLGNVRVVNARAEALATSASRQRFDVAIARAVGTIPQLADWCRPLLSGGGKVLAMKGPKAAGELAEFAHSASRRGYGRPQVHEAGLPGRQHVIVELPKSGR